MKKRFLKTVVSLCLVPVIGAASLISASAAVRHFENYTQVTTVKNIGSCPSMQGMAVGSTYLYTIKIKTDNSISGITKTDRRNGSSVVLTDAKTGSKTLTGTGHSNGMAVCSIDGKSNLFVVTADGNDVGLVRIKVDGSKFEKVGEYQLDMEGGKLASAVVILKKDDENITFLLKNKTNFFKGTLPTNATSGTIKASKAFSIDKSAVTIDGKEQDITDYINQGCGYYRDKLFVPMTSNLVSNDNVIAVYNIKNAKPEDVVKSDPELSFRLKSDSTYKALFEVEDCGIAGDGKLYFNTNCRKSSTDTNWDGIFSIDGYYDMDYTVAYNANGGSGTMSNTTVTYGISTPLSKNTFKRTGYTFKGWYATRKSDGKWLYAKGSTTKWYAKGKQPSGYSLRLYSNGANVAKQSSVKNDLVTLYAQWSNNKYTVKYNANGGKGTMSNTTVTYAVSTTLRANAFTKSGYTFKGWYATRQSDGKWLYIKGSTTGWYAKGSQPSGYSLRLYANKASVAKQSNVNGDVVTLYAQWKKK